jgi:hypothetical protein
MVNAEVLQDFTSFPNTVGKVAQLLADGRSVCVILGDHEACTTTWDGNDIRAIAEKVELEPREDGRLGYLCWTAGGTVDKPVVAGTIAITTNGIPPVPRRR